MDLLPLRTAASRGTIDGLEAARLVAAGFTLLQRSTPLVRALAGKRAAILLPTSPQFLVALAASDGRGAVLVNPLAAPAEVGFQLADAGVGAVFTIASLAGKLPPGTVHALLDDAPAATHVVRADGSSQRIDLGSHFGLSVDGVDDMPGRDEECAIVYTSAMAGTPLGAILTHRNLLANARQTVEAAAITTEDHMLAVLPFAHLFGLTVSMVAPLMVGARVSTLGRFNPPAAIERIERDGITMLMGVPSVFAGMLTAIERRGAPLRAASLRLCLCGGAPLDETLQERWTAATGVELRQGYGLTETSPVALFNRVSLPNARGSLGVPLPGVRVSIRDPKTSVELPPGVDGEICVAGETLFRGYVHDPHLGLQVRGDWLHTGDRGVQRTDGGITFRGVLKPMFTRNGFNIYPREIERVVQAMPGVRTARVTAMPDPAREHEIALEVTGSITQAEVAAWCEERLSRYKRPTRVEVRV